MDDLSEHQVNVMRREQSGLKESVAQLQAEKKRLITNGPQGAHHDFDRELHDINTEISALQFDIYAFQSRLDQRDKAAWQRSYIKGTAKEFTSKVFAAVLGVGFKITVGSNRKRVAPPSPPLLAEAISRLVTKPKLVERVLGSRSEQFHVHLKQRGLRPAQAFYWIDTLRSCFPALKQLFRWAVVGDLIRRMLGS